MLIMVDVLFFSLSMCMTFSPHLFRAQIVAYDEEVGLLSVLITTGIRNLTNFCTVLFISFAVLLSSCFLHPLQIRISQILFTCLRRIFAVLPLFEPQIISRHRCDLNYVISISRDIVAFFLPAVGYVICLFVLVHVHLWCLFPCSNQM